MELLKVVVSGNLIMSAVIDMRWYISKQKLLHKLKKVCRAISHRMDELIVRKHQVDGT